MIYFGNNRHGDINKLLQRARPGPAPGSQFFPPQLEAASGAAAVVRNTEARTIAVLTVRVKRKSIGRARCRVTQKGPQIDHLQVVRLELRHAIRMALRAAIVARCPRMDTLARAS